MVDYLVGAANAALKAILDATPHEVQPLEDEQKRISVELSNLVDFVVKGNSGSPRLQEEIRVREGRLTEIEEQIRILRRVSGPRPEVDRCWVETQVGKLVDLLARDPVGARLEIQRHIDYLRIEPAPEAGERVIRLTGRPKVDDILGGEEVVRLQLVAGVDLNQRPLGYEPFSNRGWSQGATNNPVQVSAFHGAAFGTLWPSLGAPSWVIPG